MNAGAKTKILNGVLILTSLIGYLEWGTDNRLFLFEAELQIMLKLFNNPEAALHPFTILPLIGQLLLLITIFQKKPHNVLTYAGVAGTGVLMGLMFVIGLITLNAKIVISTLPFITVAFFTIRHTRKQGS